MFLPNILWKLFFKLFSNWFWVNKPGGGSVQLGAVEEEIGSGIWRIQGKQSRKACVDVDEDRTRNSNDLLRRLLFSYTRLTACFFMQPLRAPVCVSMSVCVCLTGLGSLVVKGAAANRCVCAGGAEPCDWPAGAEPPLLLLQAGRGILVILDL